MFYYLKQYKAFSKAEKQMFWEAFFLSAGARFRLLFHPMKKIAPKLGHLRSESPVKLEDKHKKTVWLVKESVRRAASITPWRNKCFEQAITAKHMLDKRGTPSTLYLGVKKNNGRLEAHAWLRCGEQIIAGQKNYKKYTVVNFFS